MRYEALIAAVLVLSPVAVSPSLAQGHDGPVSPHFTAAETRAVDRNELLRSLMDTNPWLVRRILDAVAEHEAASGGLDGRPAVSAAFYSGGSFTDAAAAHPDAASVEWLGLLRRIRDRKAAGRHDTHSANRTAAGSIEMLDALKKARKEKGGRK